MCLYYFYVYVSHRIIGISFIVTITITFTALYTLFNETI
jgi:hypothetical protein